MKFLTRFHGDIELLPRRIGHGGEGQVFSVVGMPNLVAKIFHQPTAEHQSKLEFMVANPVRQGGDHSWVTWPVDTIYTKDAQHTLAGYLMPKLTQARQLFTCYNPAIRRVQCPGFDYRYLIHCGRNLAAAFSYAHARGYVIGDANESNTFVVRDARVTLIDADSWQMTDHAISRIFRSPYAKSDFLAPELQGRNLSQISREPHHDNFALAILLFKLIGEGNHPFDGIYHGAGDAPTIEARIATGAFPTRDRSGRWSPKGLALPFHTLHNRLQTLFIQAFVAGHSSPFSRPDATAWRDGFALAESELHCCHRNSSHWFWGHECVWCQRKNLLGGLDPFPGGRPRLVSKTTIVSRPRPVLVPVRPSPVKPLPVKPKPVQVLATPQPCTPKPAPVTAGQNHKSRIDQKIDQVVAFLDWALESIFKFFTK